MQGLFCMGILFLKLTSTATSKIRNVLPLSKFQHMSGPGINWPCRVFTSRGGGGGSIEPPKTGGGGLGKGLN